MHEPEASIDAAWRMVGRARGAIVREDADLAWVYSGGRLFNRVFRATLAPDAVAPAIAEVSSIFEAFGVNFSWSVGPRDFPADLGRQLLDQGFTGGPVLTQMHLSPLALKQPCSVSLDVKRVGDGSWLRTWADVVSEAFAIPASEFARVYRPVSERPGLGATFHLGYHAGAPVTACMLLRSGGVVGLHWVGTLARCRGRGYASTLLSRLLTDEFDDGAQQAVLLATSSGLGMYQRLGFTQVGAVSVFTAPTPQQLAPRTS